MHLMILQEALVPQGSLRGTPSSPGPSASQVQASPAVQTRHPDEYMVCSKASQGPTSWWQVTINLNMIGSMGGLKCCYAWVLSLLAWKGAPHDALPPGVWF